MPLPDSDVFDRLREVHHGMQRLLDEMIAGEALSHEARVAWRPPMDVYRTEDAIVVKLAISGVKREGIEVTFIGRSLRISGERSEQCEDCKEGYYMMEIDYGRFFREVPLPAGVQGNEISASYSDGFLLVRVPLGGGQDAARREVPIR